MYAGALVLRLPVLLVLATTPLPGGGCQCFWSTGGGGERQPRAGILAHTQRHTRPSGSPRQADTPGRILAGAPQGPVTLPAARHHHTQRSVAASAKWSDGHSTDGSGVRWRGSSALPGAAVSPRRLANSAIAPRAGRRVRPHAALAPRAHRSASHAAHRASPAKPARCAGREPAVHGRGACVGSVGTPRYCCVLRYSPCYQRSQEPP